MVLGFGSTPGGRRSVRPAMRRRAAQVGGILTILSGMFAILLIEIIHRRDEAVGRRTGYKESVHCG